MAATTPSSENGSAAIVLLHFSRPSTSRSRPSASIRGALVNVRWVFRLSQGARAEDALGCLLDAAQRSGANPGRLRETLASGALMGGKVQFDSVGSSR